MFQENEDEVMKAAVVSSDGSSCGKMSDCSDRVMKPVPHVKHLHWLHIQLLVLLLAGQASCNHTLTTPSPATHAQTSEYYFLFISVDVNGSKDASEIEDWLIQVFQTNLESCLPPNLEETTASPTSPQSAPASTYETTLRTTATTLQSYNTTAATTSAAFKTNNTPTAATTVLRSFSTTTAVTSTALKSPSTTTAATSTALKSPSTTTAATSTALKSSSTTTAATSTALKSSSTTTAATSTALKSPSTTTAATSTALKSSSTTTAATSTALKSSSTTTAATSTALKSSSTTTAATSTALKSSSTTTAATNRSTKVAQMKKKKLTISLSSLSMFMQAPVRIAREIQGNGTQTSGVSNDKTTGLFEGLEMNCTKDTAIKVTDCAVMLKLRQKVPPCCILRTLCAASKTSSDISVVGRHADRASQLNDECNSNPQEESSCTYNGTVGAACQLSETAYVAYQRNLTHCGADKQNNSCNCSAYCSGQDAFYTFQISIQDPSVNISNMVSKLKQPATSTPSTELPSPFSTIASVYKNAIVTCGRSEANFNSSPQSCSVILTLASEIPICNLSAALMNVFQSERQITFNGVVTRAAICGNAAISDILLMPQLKWAEVNQEPATFCLAVRESYILTCQNHPTVFLLNQKCAHKPSTTPSPNVIITQPNTTTSSANVTSSPLTTTTVTLNVTTIDAKVTVTATTKTTATTTNQSVPVMPSESTTTTQSAASQANALLDLTKDVSKLNSSQVNQLVSQLESLLSGPTVSLALGNTSVQIVSNLLGASAETLADSSNRIIGIVDTVALKLVLDNQAETLLSPAVALSVKPADGSNFQETFFSITDPTDVQVRGDPRSRRSVSIDSSIPQGSIRLPPSLTQDLSAEEQQLASRVQFNFYQKSTVFQDKSLGVRKLNSGILGASVANLSITGLQDDVVIHLRNTEPVPGNYVAQCVFWDFTLNDGSGGWNSSGCFVRNSTDNETVCSCNHLTSFAILLDLSRETITSRVQATILTFITYIGCGISAIFLAITLLTYLSFGKLRKDIPSKILIQLCLALLLLNLVFLVDAWLALYPDAVGLCISTAWFLHYFLLVSFTWMGLEAVHMYLALVKVFNSYISRYMLKFSLVGWGVPMIVVIIVIAIDKDNYGLVSYGKFSDGTTDEFCWLKNDIAFYVAVVAYFCVIFLFNLLMFIVVLIQLCRIKRQNPHNALHRTTLQDARSVAGLTILLGLTWGFAFFAWGPLNLPFMYLFAIFNSLQGFFIFVFHCAVKENVRRQWRTYLCCGRMRLAENSEWSRTATQKTAKKSSVTRLTSLHSSKSSKSNNSSSSSSFLVSDSSEQISGIGSPFEDRTITADEDHSADVILNEINRQYRDRQAT